MEGAHAKIAIPCRIDMMLKVHIGSVQVTKSLLALIHAKSAESAQIERFESRGSVSNNMLDGQSWSELIPAVPGSETKACSHGQGNIEPCESKTQLRAPCACRRALCATVVPEARDRGEFQPPEPPVRVGRLAMGAVLAGSNMSSFPESHDAVSETGRSCY